MIRRLMRIQYASDLHLEFLGDKTPFQTLLKPVAPVLVLAGDVGRPDKRHYADFLQHCSRNWDSVVVVAGNHELYNSWRPDVWKYKPDGYIHTAQQRMTMCEEIAGRFPNVHFLNRQRVRIGDVTFLGCTLWSDIEASASLRMNDYQMITVDGKTPVTPEDTTEWFYQDCTWLDDEISRSEEIGEPTVVVTHHLPSFKMISPQFAGSPLNSAFASDCDELIRPPIRAWIAGHTHVGMHVPFHGGEIQCVVNPLGYPGEMGSGYSREIFIDISTEQGKTSLSGSLLATAQE